MNEKLNTFLKLAKLFKENGYNLYLVGGTVRDFLLNAKFNDMDVVSDASPNEVLSFYNQKVESHFAKFGSLTLYFDGVKFDFTTLRKEKSYIDNRHPNKIKFVKKLKIDYKRRDFTINAMYLDSKFNLFDFANGKLDLENGIIRMVGNPHKRIKEDPLRIIRALRFALTNSFDIDPKLKKAILKHNQLLKRLNVEKIKQELRKIKNVDEDIKISLFNEFGVIYILDMIK